MTDTSTALDPAAVDLTTMADRITALRYAQSKAKEWEEVAKGLRSEIEEALGGPDGPAEVGVVDGLPAVRWTRVKSNRFDQTAFKKEHPEDYALYLRAQESRRFTLVEDAS